MKIIRLKSTQGFTIVELLIALSVLSTILVMATVIMIQIGALYSKGVNAANLQNTARTVASDVTASIQFSSRPPSPCTPDTLTCFANSFGAADPNPHSYPSGGGSVQVYAFCIGTVRYSYVLNRELGNDPGAPAATAQTPHVLWRDTIQQGARCRPLDLASTTVTADASAAEPAGSTSRGFEMMGDHMRLTRFYISQAPASSGVYKVEAWMAFGDEDLLNFTGGGHTNCSGGQGTQFCSTAEITTDITGRVY